MAVVCKSREIGRKEMRAEETQMVAMLIGTDRYLIHSLYCRGSLIWMYLEDKKRLARINNYFGPAIATGRRA